MKQLSQLRDSLPDSVLALGIIILAYIIVVALVRWGISALIRRFRAKRNGSFDNVVAFEDHLWLNKAKLKGKRPSTRNINPLWWVAITIVLVIGYNLFPGGLAQSELLVGQVTHVRDGDTIEVERRAIRLNGLTCDERGTPLGNQATQAMRRLVFGQTLSCTLNGSQTYDREVGRCMLSDGRDIGAELIASGLCGRCARYDPFRAYAKVQETAGPFKGAYPRYCWAFW